MAEGFDLELKKRARRRLVGAVALFLLMALVLPAVMNREPPDLRPTEVQVFIPELGETPPAQTAYPQDEAAAAQEFLPPEPPPALSAGRVGSAGDDEVALPPLVSEHEPEVLATVKPEAAAPPAKKQTPQAAVAKKPAPKSTAAEDAERARRILEGGKAKSPQKGGYIVQVIALGDAARAAALVQKLKKNRLKAYSEKAGALTRVRVGRFASKEEATRAAARIRGLDSKLKPAVQSAP